MAFTIDYDQEHECIIGTLTGEFTLEVARQYVPALRSIADKHGVTRTVTDLRLAAVKLSTEDLMVIPQLVSAKGMGDWRRALVVKADKHEAQGETPIYVGLTKMHEHDLHVFTYLVDALEWITKPECVEQE